MMPGSRKPRLETSSQFRRAGECVEDGVEIVHRVAHLVQAVLLRLPQLAAGVEGIVFEEEADFVPRFVEIAVVELGLLRRREHVPDGPGFEFLDEFERPPAQTLAVLDRHEIL